ncbi:sigma-54-dependent transcriptional regulator [Bdellovibrio svalbardensis]|uniref:Sigma-54 dependent transcriptional regulator n=1 Tax=Bdellovibrio svalbardensis TaxID=2972972 RepID=A0ABT6DKY7_9BACT|nr:sigma-54 dependent transcriptional regulator [Bdellovibrio svalbardensis]MDG0817529.1 sigma-54 dependent transcriptional regulator [Bdellovibrio svalbardensis]
MNKLHTLIVDDEAELRRSVISILQSAMPEIEFSIEEAATGKEALDKVKAKTWDLVLMDVKMPEMNGLEALTAIKEHDPRTFVVLMTAHSNLHDAVQAIKDGAYDYVEKPVKPELLTEIVRKSLEARDLVSSLALSNPVFDDDIESEFVGGNSKMKEVFNLIYRLCKVDTTVLIRGENGTGKELVARAIHFNSPRKSGSFVAINCGAIPESLMESELFGHEKGAFTGAVERKIGKFQIANNGTLFLDEIGELRPDMQVKLLRVLQEKKFTPVGGNREVKTTTRIIAATNRNLEKMMADGTFREDLFYRLNVMPIFLPNLRDRLDDIEALAQHFIKKFARQHARNITGVTPEALDMLKSYRWPGNIRELENVVERAFIVENSNQITVDSLPESIRLAPKDSADKTASVGYSGPLDFDAFKEGMEKEFIVSALKANQGRINQTVAQANIPKNTLLRKIRKYGINVKDYSGEE